MASALRYLSIPLLTAAVPAGFALWAFPEGLAPIRMVGIVIGWVGCGLLLVSLLLMLREPRLARWLGGLERMYRWHHRTGVVAYVLLLVHPLALAANGLSTSPAFAWETLSAFDEGWPVWSGWLGLLVLMLGLAATFSRRLSYGVWRWLDLPRFRGEVRYWVSVTDVGLRPSSLSMQFLGSAPAEPVPSSPAHAQALPSRTVIGSSITGSSAAELLFCRGTMLESDSEAPPWPPVERSRGGN